MPAGVGGFTLLEIIMVIALLGLMIALVIGGTVSVLETKGIDAERLALQAIAEARKQAVATGQVVVLSSDPLGKFTEAGHNQPAVRFLPLETNDAALVGGNLVEESLPLVRFYADGTCDPFRLEFTERGSRRMLTIDSWTCTAVAKAKG
jgi:type II secretory pathway pseudopilin PulG